MHSGSSEPPTVFQGTRAQIHEDWLRLASNQDSADLPLLLEHLRNATRTQCEERVGVLGAWPPHREVFDTVVGIVTDPPFSSFETQ